MSDEKGYIKLYRCIIDNDFVWEERATRLQAWLDLLMMANYQDKKGYFNKQFIEFKRGEIVTSEVKLAARWKWNKRTVTRFLTTLETEKMIVVEKSHSYTTINIVNYCKYQDFSDNTTQPSTQPTTQPSTQPTTQPSTHNLIKNNKGEESKEGKRNNNPPISPLFEMVDEKPYSGLLKEKLKDWLKYKTEKKQGYKQTGFKTLLGKIDKALNENDEDEIIECFDDAMSHNWSGVFFDKLQGKKKQESFTTDDIMQMFKKEGE